MDRFVVYQHRVQKALKSYEKIRTLSDTPSKGLYETINREALPFVKGHFTLAVIGKMSSGKSTFINALVGNRSLLPTAYEQTTCTLTEIEYGDKTQIQVIYGDGHSEYFTDTRNLLETAAIPLKYRSLPINFINKLILANKSENEILKGKDKLDKLQGESIDITLLSDYIKTHSKKNNIPVRVLIKYPLPESYRGWKIIDTPGVSALGGIEDETRNFLNGKNEYGYNNVDAIIFVNSGRYPIQDGAFKDFVDQTFLNISPEAKRRIFMVITCAADNQFMINQENYMHTAKRIFVDGYKIREERLIPVDSICNLFFQYAKSCGKQITSLKKKDVPTGWDAKFWELCIDTRNYFKNALEEMDRTVNNESLLKLFELTSGFRNLHSKLDEFIITEKSNAFKRLMDDISKDITSIYNDLRQKKSIIEANVGNMSLDALKSKMLAEYKKLEDSKNEFNDVLIKVRNEYSKNAITSIFNNYVSQMRQLRGWISIRDIQLEATNIMSEVDNSKCKVLDDLSTTLADLWDKRCLSTGLVLPQIDFKTIAIEAEQNNTYKTGGTIIGYNKKTVKRHTIGGSIKRFFGSFFRNNSWGYDEVDDFDSPIYSETEIHEDHIKAAHEFANKVYEKFIEGINGFTDSLYKLILNIGDNAKIEADRQIKLQQESYSELVKKNQTLESQRNTINNYNSKIKTIENELTVIKEMCND